jgi:sporulation protein YlmC with PRC-barrel domain
MQEITTSDDILGKEAVDPDGTILGVVTKIHIGKKDKKVAGITIDMGFTNPDLYVGVNYIKQFGVDAILLNKVPSEKFKGLKVVTAEGKSIGKVKSIVLGKTNIKEFIVSGTKFFEKDKRISLKQIKKIGNQIILKKGFKF